MFDLLVGGGENILGMPLVERKARLKKLFTPAPKQTLLVMDAIPHYGVKLYAMAVGLKVEGLVAKRKDFIYVPGEHPLHNSAYSREWAFYSTRST